MAKVLRKISHMFSGTQTLQLTQEFTQYFELFENSNQNYFLTGNAGTGKSTLIQYFREQTKKKVVVLAPTGLAAINIQGQTIHSFFKFPPRFLTQQIVERIDKYNRIYKSVDTILLDEASMIRADLLDGIDWFMRRFGRDRAFPFGGAQVILVGDLFQLPPIVTNQDREVIDHFYETPYFFSANAFRNGDFKTIELTEIFRQKDPRFIRTLNTIRKGYVDMEVLEPINQQKRSTDTVNARNTSVTLTTTNYIANQINDQELSKLPLPEFSYNSAVIGSFPVKEENLPVPTNLVLRKNARIMFVKNGTRWVNGSLGVVETLSKDEIKVRLDSNGEVVSVPKEKWEYIHYELDEADDSLEQKALGELHQYPLRLAWAITIHKSQGMTFDRVNIDYSRSPFAHGQTYVALSRCRTLEGITLSKHIYPNDVIVDPRVPEFLSRVL